MLRRRWTGSWPSPGAATAICRCRPRAFDVADRHRGLGAEKAGQALERVLELAPPVQRRHPVGQRLERLARGRSTRRRPILLYA